MSSRNNKRPNEGGEEALVRRGGNKMMVERRHFIITITSSFLFLSLFYKVLPPQNRNDIDLDGFQNDPAIYEAFECPSRFDLTNFHWSPQQNLLWCKVSQNRFHSKFLNCWYQVPKAGSTTWVQIFLSLVGAGVGADDVEQRWQDSTQDATSGDEKLENRIHAISIMVKQSFYTFLGGRPWSGTESTNNYHQ